MISWQSLEEQVRWIAELKWSTPCAAEDIGGVRIDGVCKLDSDEWVLIEVSKENNVTKLRTDLAKLQSVKNTLFGQGIFARCFFITQSDENRSLRETAESQNVKYYTAEAFESAFMGGARYKRERLLKPFGSAVKIDSGESDDAPYIPTAYFDKTGGEWSINRISESLKKGGKFILTGQFGSGKSRCTMEIFHALTVDSQNPTPIAIDLRDAWGKTTLNSIIREHLETMGLSDVADVTLQSLTRGNNPILLDGFDELGSQAWSSAPERMAEIRLNATKGVRQIAQNLRQCGLLVTGRDHYFSSDKEMLRSLGLPSETTILKCPDQFTPEQARKYLDSIDGQLPLPQWIPRKPLICQLIASLPADEMSRLTVSSGGEVEFFDKSLDAICERETRISPVIDGVTLRELLIRLALFTKSANDMQNRLSSEDVNHQFKAVTGFTPGEESAVLLQKLPYLGRFQSDSPDRVFIDDYVREGLAGLGMHLIANRTLQTSSDADWKKPLGSFGLKTLSELMEINQTIAFARQEANHGRYQSACDYVAATLMTDISEINYYNLGLASGHVSELRLVDKSVSNLSLTNIYVDEAYIDGIESSNVYFNDSYIGFAYGVSQRQDLPEMFGPDIVIDNYDTELNSSAIADLDLTNGQKTLLSIIQKLFFQRGSGRKEGALLRGTARYWDESVADRSLKFMLRDGIVVKKQGREGLIYVPNREFTNRMREIRSARKGSNDLLWVQA